LPTERRTLEGPTPASHAAAGTVARCEGLVKTYRTATSEVRALKGITFTFREAVLTAVTGPSGSGKSSLLRLLAGMDRPTSGALEVSGMALETASARSLRRLRRNSVGYVFQRPSDNFLPHLTVGEHLRLAAHGYARRGSQATELLNALGIAHRVGHLPSELSGGEQQRAAIAQVLIGGARLVIADEPTAELDSASARSVVESIHDLAASGVSFIVATHDQAVVRRADATLELDHGVQRGRRAVKPDPTAHEQIPPASRVEPETDDGDGLRWRPPSPPAATDLVEDDAPVLVVDGVSKSYRRGDEEVHALRDVDLSLLPGQLTGLVGRSGSGKTTLLNIVAGWEQPDAGHVTWNGRRTGIPSWSEVAVVPQKLGLLDDLTVRENIEYPARLSGRLREVQDEVDSLLEDLGLDELQNRYPKETSLGEQQRTAVARAIVLGPKVVLADEPTGHQDRMSTQRVFEALERAAGRGSSCLVATHNEEVAGFLGRLLHISDGSIAGA
jgi:putative ABC transport system ATP-binding protein